MIKLSNDIIFYIYMYIVSFLFLEKLKIQQFKFIRMLEYEIQYNKKY